MRLTYVARMSDVLVYGSYGYSGDLIAREALDQGLDVVLAGRNREKVTEQQAELGTDGEVFALDESEAVRAALEDVEVAIHCAGPFVHTAEPMVDACLETGTHYLDITGEIAVFEDIEARSGAAEEAGVMLLPGTAFDVVPTDCMAAYLEERLPSATDLSLAFDIMPAWEIAGGTLATAIENSTREAAGVFLGNTVVRRDGEIEVRSPAWKSRSVDFGYATKTAVTIPWGDVFTAYHTTGVPNIEVYAGLSRPERVLVKSFRYIGWMYRFEPFRRSVAKAVQRIQSGPSGEERRQDRSGVWGRAVNDEGEAAEARLLCPGGYDVVAQAPVAITRRALEGDAPPGFQTPAGAYGPDLVLEVDGVTREDVQ